MSTSTILVRLLAVIFFLGALVTTPAASAQGTSWYAKNKVENVVYFFYGDRAERYNLITRSWLPPVTWPSGRGAATAAWADSDGLYAIYGRALYRSALNGTGEFHVFNLSADVVPAGLVSVSGFLVAKTNSTIVTINKSTNQFAAERVNASGSIGFSVAYNSRKIFSRSIGYSPSDILAYTVGVDGSVVVTESPYHGDYPDAINTWVSNDESTVFDSSGTVYATSDLRTRTLLGFSISDVTHTAGGAAIALAGSRLNAYAPNLFPSGALTLGFSPLGIVADGSDVLCFTPQAGFIDVVVVPLGSLAAPTPGPALDPNGLAYTPDAMLLDKDGVVLLLSKANKSIFRWDPVGQQYLTSISLLDTPAHFAYSAPQHRIYVGYATGLIRRIELNGASFPEQNFALLGTAITGLVATGNYLLSIEGVNSAGMRRTFNAAGAQVEAVSRYLYSASEYQWSEANQKVYNYDFSSMVLTEVNANGTAYPAEAPGGIGAITQVSLFNSPFTLPFRISPDGTTLVSSNGSIFNALTLVRSVNGLANSIADAVWQGSALRTLRTSNGFSEFQQWNGASYAPGLAQSYPGTALRLFGLSGNRLLAVSLRSNGVPFFYVVDASFNLVPPPALSAPGGLAGTVASPSVVELRWADVPGATGFRVERRTGRQPFASIGTTAAYVTAFSDATVATGQVYDYRVFATNGALTSPASNETMVSLTPPPIPTNLVIFSTTVAGIRINWNASAGAAGYIVERKVGSTGTFTSLGSTDRSTTTYLDNAASTNTLYTYQVRATNALGQSAPSNTASYQTPAIVPFQPFISGFAAGPDSITLSLSVSNSPDYTLVERMSGTAPWAVVTTLTGSQSSFIDTGLTPSTSYSYRARSVNGAGSSPYSNSYTISTAAPQPPAAANLQRVRTLSASSLRLIWSNVSNEIGYRIQRLTGESTLWSDVTTVGADVTSFDDTGLPAGLRQSYRVVAFNAVGDAVVSNTLSGTPFEVVRVVEDNFDPALHAGVWQEILGGSTLNGGAGFGGSNVLWFGGSSSRSATTLPQDLAGGAYVGFRYRAGNQDVDGPTYWNNAEAGESLVVEYSVGGGWQSLGGLDIVFPAASTWQTVEIPLPLAALSGHTSIRIRQSSHSGAGYDVWAIDDFYIESARPAAPAAPSFVFAGATSDTQVAISWEAVPGASRYTVERALGPQGPWTLVVNTFTSTFYTDVQLLPATWYAYRVTAQNAGGSSATSLLAWAQTYSQLAAWQLANFGSTTTAPAQDSDGVSTLTKFAFGIPVGGQAVPHVPGSNTGGVPAIWRDPASGRLQVEFVRRRPESNPGISYRVELSTDLANWTQTATLLGRETIDNVWERVRYEDPANAGKSLGRVGVTAQ